MVNIDKEAWPIAKKLLLMNEVAATVELTHYLKKAYKQGRIDGLNEEPTLPVEPTEKMIEDGIVQIMNLLARFRDDDWEPRDSVIEFYKAMTTKGA